ncbi:MAG: biotin--[acetyl-CoA-carboxylase] ligase [Actinomycetota bacterium]|jgi:BirA family biotin operon repressor/biotin-[acetyl-CoA-carboxylase] ligase|nr:biotin--[acetyl-CoA-carboxylase] ligase [Actinomycetota bacterium]
MSAAHPFEVRRFERLGSTNTYLLEQARSGAPAGLVAVADHQSAGRGRLGRRWEAPPGTCLLVSVLLRPCLDPEDRPLGAVAVALAAVDACREVAGVRAEVKWPNDLVVDDRKLAGVLAEVDPGAPGGVPGSVAMVVGLGLNVDWPGPPEAGGTCLSDVAGRAVEREALLEGWLAALGGRAGALGGARGRKALAQELRVRCATLGRQVRVELTDGSAFAGHAVDLTGPGHLVVDVDGARRVVAVGDVRHLRPAPPPEQGAASGDPAASG